MVRTNEGGSVLSFAVVGIILAILLVGGVTVVRQHYVSGQKTTSAPTKVTHTDKDKTTAPTASNSDKTPTDEGKASPDGSTGTAAPTTSQDTTSSTNAAPASSAPTATSGSELPHTGPVETLTTVLAVGLLTSSSIAYVRSRRYRLSSTSI